MCLHRGRTPFPDPELDRLLAEVLATPPMAMDLPERLSRELTHASLRTQQAPTGAGVPAPWLWLLPVGCTGLAVAMLFAALSLGLPIFALAQAALAAAQSLPAYVGSLGPLPLAAAAMLLAAVDFALLWILMTRKEGPLWDHAFPGS